MKFATKEFNGFKNEANALPTLTAIMGFWRISEYKINDDDRVPIML